VEEVRDAHDDEILFVVLYQREAHPGELSFEEIDQPEEYDARLELAKKTCGELSISTLVVIDGMDNAVRDAYGSLPNSAYVIDKGGEVLYKEAWARPDEWGALFEELFGGG